MTEIPSRPREEPPESEPGGGARPVLVAVALLLLFGALAVWRSCTL